MERANLALVILSIEVKNAGARQRARMRRLGTQSLSVDGLLHQIRGSLKNLRVQVKRLDRLEERERLARKQDKPARDKLAGVNRKLTGTFGK